MASKSNKLPNLDFQAESPQTMPHNNDNDFLYYWDDFNIFYSLGFRLNAQPHKRQRFKYHHVEIKVVVLYCCCCTSLQCRCYFGTEHQINQMPDGEAVEIMPTAPESIVLDLLSGDVQTALKSLVFTRSQKSTFNKNIERHCIYQVCEKQKSRIPK